MKPTDDFLRWISKNANLIGFAAILGLIGEGCDRPIAATTSPAPDSVATNKPVARVEVVKPSRQTIRRVVEQPGQVEAFESTAIHAKVAGYVRSWSSNIGSKVAKGQILAEIDVPEADAEVDRRRSMLDQAQARRGQAEAAIKVAHAEVASSGADLVEARSGMKRSEADLARWKSEFARVEQLFRERAQTGSLVDETRSKLRGAEAMLEEVEARVKSSTAAVDRAKAGLDKVVADLGAATAGVDVARSEVRVAEVLLAYNPVVAPYDGVVTRRGLDTGQLTVPGGQGEPLYVVARSDLVTVVVDVPELFAAAIDLGDRATIRVQAITGRGFEGKVARTAYALDKVPDPPRRGRPPQPRRQAPPRPLCLCVDRRR